MKTVLISIQPKWCELIANGKKTIEVRKTRPKLEMPFKVYIYCTNWKDNTYWKNHYKGKIGKVIGEFVCDRIDNYDYDQAFDESMGVFLNSFGYAIMSGDLEKTCLSYKEIEKYGNTNNLYGWHITDLKIYDKPKELSEFYRHDNTYDNAFGWAFEDREKNVPITRPPQSWCYVEELQNG